MKLDFSTKTQKTITITIAQACIMDIHIYRLQQRKLNANAYQGLGTSCML